MKNCMKNRKFHKTFKKTTGKIRKKYNGKVK